MFLNERLLVLFILFDGWGEGGLSTWVYYTCLPSLRRRTSQVDLPSPPSLYASEMRELASWQFHTKYSQCNMMALNCINLTRDILDVDGFLQILAICRNSKY